MARLINRLSARTFKGKKKPGLHADGAGLYLRVEPPSKDGSPGAKRWAFIFRWRGRRKEMGLGSVNAVSLADARDAAKQAHDEIAAGRNPIEEKRRQRASQGLHSFGDVADALVTDLSPQWQNEKHRAQWKTALEVDAAALRPLAVADVGTDDVLAVLKPIWAVKPETASRLRGRIERVLDAAKAKGLRVGENPARWRGHLALLLPKRQRLTRGHHPAMPFDQVAGFVGELRAGKGIGARALEFTILTAARTGEVIDATAAEFDLDAAVWTVPAERMKARREHRVPLSMRAIAIVRELWPDEKLKSERYIFRSLARDIALSNMAMTKTMRDLGKSAFTVHGFRSSFRDWAGERTTFPREIIEAALAHAVGDATERAYRRGDALAKRAKLMEAWARYCEPRESKGVVGYIG